MLTIMIALLQIPISTVLPNPSKEIALLDAHLEGGTPILYFGDSVIKGTVPSDSDKRSIPQLLEAQLSNKRVGRVSHAAYQMDLFLDYCRYVIRHPTPPEIIVIPINMRSFSPLWDLMPWCQFDVERILLSQNRFLLKAFMRPLRIFDYKPTPSITEEEFLRSDVFRGSVRIGEVEDFQGPEYRAITEGNTIRKIHANYLFPLDRDHRKMRSMRLIAEELTRAGIRPVFYVTPVDVQSCAEYEPEFAEDLAQKVHLIEEILKARNVPLIDLSTSVDPEGFFWSYDPGLLHYPNEHINQRGKKIVANRLAEFIIEGSTNGKGRHSLASVE